jgi:hypothetical protein
MLGQPAGTRRNTQCDREIGQLAAPRSDHF